MRPSQRAALALALTLSCLFAACWDDPVSEIEKTLCDSIDRWHDRALKTCKEISDRELRDLCLIDVARKNNELSAKKQEAIEAYINCDEEAFKRAIDAIKALTKLVGLVTSANFEEPVGPAGTVSMSASGNLVGVTGDVHHYRFAGGKLVITAWQLPPETSDLTGDLELSLVPVAGGGFAGSVSQLALSFTLEGTPASLTLHPDGLPSQVEIDRFGAGSVRFHGSLAWDVFLDAVVWVELPVQAAADLSSLALETGGAVPGDQVFPLYLPCTVQESFDTAAVGWSNSPASTCSFGAFVLGSPTQVVSGGVTTQVGGDRTGGAGNAVFTGVNTSPGVDDVDGGVCILDSPPWNVAVPSTLSVWHFHGQRDAGDDPAGDFFRLEVSLDGGATYTSLVHLGDGVSNAAWTEATAAVPAGSVVQLRLQVSDGIAAGDLIEGGVDDLTICSAQ